LLYEFDPADTGAAARAVVAESADFQSQVVTTVGVPCAGLPVADPFSSYQVVVAAILIFPFAKSYYIPIIA
jgi:hypothetical protein